MFLAFSSSVLLRLISHFVFLSTQFEGWWEPNKMESYFGERDYLFTDTASVVVILSLVAIMVIFTNLRKKGGNRLPPGPICWPLVGNLHLLGSLPHQSLFDLSKKYGPLMYLSLGASPTVVACSSALAREFLKINDQIFASRPQTAAAKILGYDGAGIGWAPYGSHLRMMRTLCLTELFSSGRLEFFRNLREEEIFSVVQSVWRNSQSHKEIDVAATFSSLTNNTICRMILGKKYLDSRGAASAEASEFKKLMDEYYVLAGVFNIGDYIRFLKPYDLQGYERRMRDVMKTLDGVLEEIIKQRRQQQARKTKEDEDLLDVMLSTMEKQAELSLVNVKAVILDLLLAGTDTTAVTSEWALSELLRHPASLQKVQDELDREVGRERLVQESDLDRLTYLKAVVKETLRLHPPGPLLVPHRSTQACKVNGYDIPANATLLVNVWAIGRDPDVWSKAWEFDPERFGGKSRDFRGHHFELIPFGSGRRACPGLPLAVIMVHMGLASLIQSFEWRVAGEGREVDMRESFGLILHRGVPLQAVATPRLPLHLYTNQIN